MTVDQNFLSPRDLLLNGQICLDGPLISDATKFAVECLNLPQSVDAICERAGITRDVYNQYADILNQLFKGFNAMFEIADDFGVSFSCQNNTHTDGLGNYQNDRRCLQRNAGVCSQNSHCVPYVSST